MKSGIALAVLFAIYLVVGFFLLPWVLEHRIVARVTEVTGRETVVENVRLNPLLFTLSVEGFRMASAGSSPGNDNNNQALPDLLHFDELFLDLSVTSSLRHWAPVLTSLRWKSPTLYLLRDADGELNFQDIVRRLEQDHEEEPAPRDWPKFHVQESEIVEGAIHIEDAAVTPEFAYATVPIDLTLIAFGTLELTEGALVAEAVDGGRLSWDGQVFLEPFGSEGSVVAENIEIEAFQTYLAQVADVEIASTVASFEIPYSFNTMPDEELLTIHNARAELRTLKASMPGSNEPFFELDLAEANGVGLRLAAREFSAELLRFRDGRLLVERRADGTFSLHDLLPDEPPEPNAEEWSYHVHTVETEDVRLDYLDETFATPLAYPLTINRLTIAGISEALNEEVSVSLESTPGDKGLLHVEGHVIPQPLAVALNVSFDAVPLAPFGPVAATWSKITAINGTVQGDGTIESGTQKEGGDGHPSFAYFGSVGLRELSLAESAKDDSLLTIPEVDFETLYAQTGSPRLSAEAVRVEAPMFTVIRTEDGKLNWLTLIEATAEGDSANEAPGEDREPGDDAPLFELSIASIDIQNGQVDFEDRAVAPAAEHQLGSVSATIRDFSLGGETPVELQLDGLIDEAAPLKANAQWQAADFGQSTDGSLHLDDYPMPPLSPYSAHFIGHRIAGGELTLDLQYRIRQQQLNGTQSVILRRFELGSETPDEPVFDLPMDFAVSLLQDRDDTIDLNILLSGDLDDTVFDFGNVIRDAMGSLITMAVSSPFRLLGGIFAPEEKEDVDLSHISFAPGASALDEEARNKLNILAQALYDRPRLTLAYFATIDPKKDPAALAEENLHNRLSDLHPEDDPDLQDENIYRQLITRAYRAEFDVPPPPTDPPEPEEEIAPPPPDPDPAPRPRLRRPTRPSHFGRSVGRQVAPEERATETVAESPEADSVNAPDDPAPNGEIEPAGLPPVEEMEAALLETVEVTETDLDRLRRDREEAAQSHLLAAEPLEADRLEAIDPDERKTPVEADVPAAAVLFELR